MAIQVDPSDILRITLKSNYGIAVAQRNVFHFVVSTDDATTPDNCSLIGAALSFYDFTVYLIQAVTNQIVTYTSVLAELMDPATWLAVNGEEYVIPGGGVNGDDTARALPPQDAWSFKYTRSTADFRHGYKRFGGVPENAQDDGLAAAGVVGDLDALADQLTATLPMYLAGNSLTSTASMFPIIYKARRYGGDVRPVEFQAPAAVSFSGIGTQNTRKFNRGS